MAHKNNEQNLSPLAERTPEEQRIFHSLGGKASQKKQREQRTFANILKTIADLDCVDTEVIDELKELGFEDHISNKVAWVLPFITNLKKGDSKSFQMAMEMLREDRKREVEIQRLQEEVNKLLLEQEQLKSLNSALGEQIQIVMNVGNTTPTLEEEENEEEE